MKTFQQFLEGSKINRSSNTAVFTFGRMNPPTVGHVNNIMELRNFAEGMGYDYFTVVSQTHDSKDNPLPYDLKTKYIDLLCNGKSNVIYNSDIHTVFDAFKQFKSEGYENVVFGIGGDRYDKFKSVIPLYTRDLYFNKVSVVKTGKRVDGVSGSAAREAALNGDFASFSKIMPHDVNPEVIKQLFNDVSKRLKGVFNEKS